MEGRIECRTTANKKSICLNISTYIKDFCMSHVGLENCQSI